MNDNNHHHDIFISYSRKNRAVVLPIKDEIEQLGLTCWIDLSDIPCGEENFKRKVISGIKQTRIAFLFFLSAESQGSEYAMKEINFAKKTAKKRVILVKFNDDEMTDEFSFDYQDADVIDWRQPEQKAKLLRDLRLWADKANETHSSTTTQKTSAESVKTQPEGFFVVCPICGKKNRMEDTFRCRKCGQDNLCLHHRDNETYLCCECKGSVCGSGGMHKRVQLWKGGPYWAETNIGADHPWESGYFFWWGDTIGYKRKTESGLLACIFNKEVWSASDGSVVGFEFGKRNIPTYGMDYTMLLSEGWISEKGILNLQNDAARVQWGGGWRLPTNQEFEALVNMCDWTWTTISGVNGYVIRGRGEYSSGGIFLPAAGYDGGASPDNTGSGGYFWTSEPSSDNKDARSLYFDSSSHRTYDSYRNYGRPIRPVQGFAGHA